MCACTAHGTIGCGRAGGCQRREHGLEPPREMVRIKPTPRTPPSSTETCLCPKYVIIHQNRAAEKIPSSEASYALKPPKICQLSA